ncbi:MAG: molybdopterin-binding protein [Eubacteriales bacterium]|nr:molybdopterin-binding protein [Eubacteriales bacterium]
MKLIDTKEAVGHVLCHDLTQIIRGVTKDARFRKGHIVTEEDIPVLLSMGKEHLYVWEKQPGMLHEDEAADRLRALCQNAHMHATPVKEGKVELIADIDGLFQVDVERLDALNGEDELMIATRHTNTAVKKGDKLAGTRIIPLLIAEERLRTIEAIAGDRPLLTLTPWQRKTCGLITTGSEVANGLIEDTFTPVIVRKLAEYGITVTAHHFPGDDVAAITAAALDCKAKGVDMIVCTGGMSVDPDDKTPKGIRDTGASIVAYGAPVLPGAMFLLGYFEDGTPIMGLPGCVMYARATVFDLVLPRVAADVPVTRKALKGLGHGGLCLGCPECHYPICPFGKGR